MTEYYTSRHDPERAKRAQQLARKAGYHTTPIHYNQIEDTYFFTYAKNPADIHYSNDEKNSIAHNVTQITAITENDTLKTDGTNPMNGDQHAKAWHNYTRSKLAHRKTTADLWSMVRA